MLKMAKAAQGMSSGLTDIKKSVSIESNNDSFPKICCMYF